MGGRGSKQSLPPPLIRQFRALLFNRAIQGGKAQWTRCSRGSIAVNPCLVCMGTTYLLRGPAELSVGLCVLHRPPLCLRWAFADFPPKTCEWTEQPVTSSCFHPFNFTGIPKPPALTQPTYTERKKRLITPTNCRISP